MQNRTREEAHGIMRLMRNTLILASIATSLTCQAAFAAPPAAKKQATAKKSSAAAVPTVEEQLKAMQEAIQSQASQIAGLREEMAARNAELVKARQEAAEARAAAKHHGFRCRRVKVTYTLGGNNKAKQVGELMLSNYYLKS